uniref:Potassium channel subfamily K member a n=1 Tax=Petromyzon marinus TaxID=7757 RepID=A0A482IAM4_PETMA|nr:potassium channel subfamily K member a [Petromyzon marinus]
MASRSLTCFLALLATYALYLVLGAIVFSTLERPYEERLRMDVRRLRDAFVRQHACLSDEALEGFLRDALEARTHGVSALRNATAGPHWDFVSALFFASTVLTTVGYGHTVPLSDAGKALCILYAVLGIPFTLLLLTSIVQRLMEHLTRRPLRSLAAALLLLLLEGWGFLGAFYFCFISLSTVGLGDYVPGEADRQPSRELYKTTRIVAPRKRLVYLLLGLISMLLVLETFCELPQMRRLTAVFQPQWEPPSLPEQQQQQPPHGLVRTHHGDTVKETGGEAPASPASPAEAARAESGDGMLRRLFDRKRDGPVVSYQALGDSDSTSPTAGRK